MRDQKATMAWNAVLKSQQIMIITLGGKYWQRRLKKKADLGM